VKPLNELEPAKHLRGGNVGAYEEAVYACPYCDAECFADWVDVGVGIVQCGPFYCTACGASEGDDRDPRELTEREKITGWFEPGSPVHCLANTVDGHLVDHRTAKEAYRLGALDAAPF
jgi:hypothetical protein